MIPDLVDNSRPIICLLRETLDVLVLGPDGPVAVLYSSTLPPFSDNGDVQHPEDLGPLAVCAHVQTAHHYQGDAGEDGSETLETGPVPVQREGIYIIKEFDRQDHRPF